MFKTEAMVRERVLEVTLCQRRGSKLYLKSIEFHNLEIVEDPRWVKAQGIRRARRNLRAKIASDILEESEL